MTIQTPTRTADEPIATFIGLYPHIGDVVKLTIVTNTGATVGGKFTKRVGGATQTRTDIVGRLDRVEECYGADEVTTSTVILGGSKLSFEWNGDTARRDGVIMTSLAGSLEAVYAEVITPAKGA